MIGAHSKIVSDPAQAVSRREEAERAACVEEKDVGSAGDVAGFDEAKHAFPGLVGVDGVEDDPFLCGEVADSYEVVMGVEAVALALLTVDKMAVAASQREPRHESILHFSKDGVRAALKPLPAAADVDADDRATESGVTRSGDETHMSPG